MNKYAPIFALVGFALTFGLGLFASGCASPAHADEARPVIIDLQYHTVTETIGQRETYVTADGVTIDVEPATLTLVLDDQH